MKKLSIVCLAVCAALVVGCRKSTAELAEQVKSEMQQELVNRAGLSRLVVEDVRLVRTSETGNEYTGVATGNVGGESVKFDVTCKYDGDNVVWDAKFADGPAALAALAVKEAADEACKKVGEAWPKVKTAFGEACEAAASAVAEGAEAAAAAVAEGCDQARAKTAEFLEGVGRKIGEGASSAAPDGEAGK